MATSPGTVQPTDQQRAAIDTRHVSIVLSAGAGCGKTSVLTQRFLSHLEPGPESVELSRLVAITFTERAAREMRDRIRSQCLERLRNCDPEFEEHWLNIVRGLDAARISTIHAFCSTLLRTNAVEADLDPKFGLLDETLGASFLSQAVESGLHKLLANGDRDASELVYEFGLSRTLSLLTSLVPQRYRIVPEQWQALAPRELARQWEDHFHHEFVPQQLRDLADAPETRRLLELLDEHTSDHKVMQERCAALRRLIPALPTTSDPVNLLNEIAENARVQGGGTKKNWDSEDVYAAVRDGLSTLRDAVRDLLARLDYNPEHLFRGAEISLCALRTALAVGAHFDAAKADAAVVDFDDLLLRARNLLRDHASVRARVSAGIALLMVDEFQDTDPIQDEIVQLLAGDAFLTGKVFVVGDVKQSIYRFRRAEPQVFLALREKIARAGRLPLNENFRSQPAILQFVNALFDGALGDSYEALHPALPQVSPTPGIEFLFTRPEAQNDDAPDAEAGKETAPDRRRREADWMARRLKQLLTDGVPRIPVRSPAPGAPALRPVRPADIVILFRAMSDVRYYEEGLRAHGLDYYVVGGRAFFAQQEIYDVANLCQFLSNVDDQVALVGVLRSPFFSLSDDSIVALGPAPAAALHEPPPPYLSAEQQDLIRYAGQVLRELRDRKDELPIAQLINLAVERTGYDAALLTEFLGARKLANLRKLINMARQFDRSGLFTLADFVERLREAVADETHEPLAATHPESSDIIRLMSIHQSKGLEFPVVVIADMDRPVQAPQAGADLDPLLGPVISLPEKFGEKREHLGVSLLRHSERRLDAEESLRILYVATTRAANLLILSASFAKEDRPSQGWLKLVSERFDLTTGQPRLGPTAGGVSVLAKYSRQLPDIHIHQAAPQVAPEAGTRGTSLALSELNDAVTNATAGPLPDTCRVLAADLASQRRFSVSALEELDRQDAAAPLNVLAASATYEDLAPADRRTAARTRDPEELGILVHQVLERLDFANPGDVSELVAQCVAAAGGPADESTRQAATTCVERLLQSPLAGELAGARTVYREIDFLLDFPIPRPGRPARPDSGTRYQIAGTMDCLVETAGGEWIIVDYKTRGSGHSRNPADLVRDYEIQLGLYALALEQFLGRLPDRIDLVFLGSGLGSGLGRLRLTPTAGPLQQISQRVAGVLARATNTPAGSPA